MNGWRTIFLFLGLLRRPTGHSSFKFAFCHSVILLAAACGGPPARYERLRELAAGWPAAAPDSPSPRADAGTADGPALSQRPDLDADPFAGEVTLALDRLLETVERRNPSLDAGRHAVAEAAARYPQVVSLDDPGLSYGLAPLSLGQDRAGYRFELSQRLPWPGKLGLAGERALSGAEAAAGELEAARRNLALAATRAFLDYYVVHRAIEINEIEKEILAGFRRVAETRYTAGSASKQDALAAEVEETHLLHRSIVLERMRRVAAARINTLLDRRPGEVLPPPPDSLEDAGARPEGRPDPDALAELAAGRRPELAALAARMRAAEAELALARKAYYPDFMTMVGHNSMWGDPDMRPMAGLGLNLPLRLNRRSAAVDEAAARIARLRAELAAAEAGVALEVREAYERLVESEHVLHLFRERLLPAAREGLAAAEDGYRSGANDFLTLLAAEKRLTGTDLRLIEAEADHHLRGAELERAVGEDLENDRTTE